MRSVFRSTLGNAKSHKNPVTQSIWIRCREVKAILGMGGQSKQSHENVTTLRSYRPRGFIYPAVHQRSASRLKSPSGATTPHPGLHESSHSQVRRDQQAVECH